MAFKQKMQFLESEIQWNWDAYVEILLQFIKAWQQLFI